MKNARLTVINNYYRNNINKYYSDAHLIVFEITDMSSVGQNWDSNYGLYVHSIIENDIPDLTLDEISELDKYEVVHECTNYPTSSVSDKSFKNKFTIILFVKPIEKE